MSTKNILFVDDEAHFLQGLQRTFNGMRLEWEMFFANSGMVALKILEQNPVDVVVCDVGMPGMSGPELLTHVMKRYPHVVRIALSTSDREEMPKLVGPAHQCLGKPFDPNALREAITRCFVLRDLLANEKIKTLISRMQTVPAVPSLYEKLHKELQVREPSVNRIGEIIAADMGMTAKILQLVNSAFFGLPQKVNNPTEAVIYLGLETVKSLVLTIQIFSRFEQSPIQEFSIESLWQHSLTTGVMARWIGGAERVDQETQDHCFVAGLLHDVGRLIAVVNIAEQYRSVLNLACSKKLVLWEAEQEILGVTHAEIGAYLLGLWGLPNFVVEAVAFHHHPERSASRGFSVPAAVHVANAFANARRAGNPGNPECQIATKYLTEVGLISRVENWRAICSGERKAQ